MLGALAAAGALGAVAVVSTTGAAGAHERWAHATLRAADGSRVGSVSFVDERHSDETEIRVKLRESGTLNGFHGLHIHANDVSSNGDGCIADAGQPSATWFVSADGHWKHDPAELHGQHAGDLPSVYVNADGSASIEFDVDKLTPSEVVGRAVILHVGPDNFGNVPVGAGTDQYTPGATALAKTQATGNAGDRYACGVISGH
jgi:Cu-Zn family superoxide dismutase